MKDAQKLVQRRGGNILPRQRKEPCKGTGLKVHVAFEEQRGISCGQKVLEGQEEGERGWRGFPRALCPSEGVCLDSVRCLEDF